MVKIVLEEFAKKLKLLKVVAISRLKGHVDRLTRLFGGIKGFYDGQKSLTSRYFKRCYNVKNFYSDLLLALFDARYRFIWVKIGAP